MSVQEITSSTTGDMGNLDLEHFIANLIKQLELANENLKADNEWMLSKREDKLKIIKKMQPFLSLKNSFILTGLFDRMKNHIEVLNTSFSQTVQNFAITTQHCEKLNYNMLEQLQNKQSSQQLTTKSYNNVKAELKETDKKVANLLKERETKFLKYSSDIKSTKQRLQKEILELEELKLCLIQIRQMNDDFQIYKMMRYSDNKSTDTRKYLNFF